MTINIFDILFCSVWCRMHEENGKAVKKVKPDAGMGDGWTRIQVRHRWSYLKLKNVMIHCFVQI